MNFKPPKRANEHNTYTTGWLVEYYGSYEKIAQALYREHDIQTAGATVGRWFREGNTPPHIAVALAQMTEQPAVLGTLCPFLKDYLIEEACP